MCRPPRPAPSAPAAHLCRPAPAVYVDVRIYVHIGIYARTSIYTYIASSGCEPEGIEQVMALYKQVLELEDVLVGLLALYHPLPPIFYVVRHLPYM